MTKLKHEISTPLTQNLSAPVKMTNFEMLQYISIRNKELKYQIAKIDFVSEKDFPEKNDYVYRLKDRIMQMNNSLQSIFGGLIPSGMDCKLNSDCEFVQNICDQTLIKNTIAKMSKSISECEEDVFRINVSFQKDKKRYSQNIEGIWAKINDSFAELKSEIDLFKNSLIENSRPIEKKHTTENNTSVSVRDSAVLEKTSEITNFRLLQSFRGFGGKKSDGVYKGQLMNGLPHGRGKWSGLFFYYEGIWKNGMPDGEGSVVENEGVEWKGVWQDGVLVNRIDTK